MYGDVDDDETINEFVDELNGRRFSAVYFLLNLSLYKRLQFRNSVETKPNQTKCGMNENNNEL